MIYKKSWKATPATSTGAAQTIVANAFTNLGDLIKLDCTRSGSSISSVPFYATSGYYMYLRYVRTTNIIGLEAPNGMAGDTLFITAYYTKTTG